MSSQEPMRKWLHDLRNAVNAVCITVAAAKRLLDKGEHERANAFLGQAEAHCEQCRELTRSPPGGD